MARPSVKDRILEIEKRLEKRFPAAKCSLDFKTPFELLVSTILSAQCTDVRVNQVTPKLFVQFPDARSMAQAKPSKIESLIRSTGFYKAKTKSILAASKSLVEQHGGEVPRSMEELTKLRGVGRKTANVILGNAFGIHVGIAVDTHVGRLARRLALSKQMDPVKVEADLLKLTNEKSRTQISHLLIFHGRETCSARKPLCEKCVIADLCPKVGL